MVGLDVKPATSQITHDNSRPGQLGGGSYRVRMVWEMLPERLQEQHLSHLDQRVQGLQLRGSYMWGSFGRPSVLLDFRTMSAPFPASGAEQTN